MIEKLPGESTKAYQALLDYWAMGAGRSLTGLVAQYTNLDLAPTTRYSTVAGWSSRYTWNDRIAAEIIRIAHQNEGIAQEEREKLFRKQFDIIHNALHIEALARNGINFENVSIAQYTGLLNAIHKMLADLRTNDTEKIALTDPDGKREWKGKVEKSDIEAIAAQLKIMRDE